ncbi:hypothetical protein EKD04_003900 [Chloroflexales bacterium ZM16-3]|nr:hypothetical protein [Chloroflexales bacterium ZM16-3]
MLVLLAVIVLAGCAARPDDSGPADAARRFVAALEARDASAIIDLLEPSDWRAETGPELRSYLGMVSSLELRDAAYSVAENNGPTAQVTEAITASATDIYPNMPSYYRRLRLLGSGRIDACAALGGAADAPGGRILTVIGLGAMGVILLIGTLAWAGLSRRRRRPTAPVETPRRGVSETPRRGVSTDVFRQTLATRWWWRGPPGGGCW